MYENSLGLQGNTLKQLTVKIRIIKENGNCQLEVDVTCLK